MDARKNTEGIVRARRSAARTLLAALKCVGSGFSERELADEWVGQIQLERSLLPFGWYQPPPHGMSVLIGNPPDYGRLVYESLRSPETWPSSKHRFGNDSLLYPYFSAIDRATAMIGDHVGTYYSGSDRQIRDWMRDCYRCTKRIADSVELGMTFAELYSFGMDELASLGAGNNNFSLGGGLADDVGHTVPFFGCELIDPLRDLRGNPDAAKVSHKIAGGREFVSGKNTNMLTAPTAVTIEPQILSNDLPLVGFHMIVVLDEAGAKVVSLYEELFSYFGMSDWISR